MSIRRSKDIEELFRNVSIQNSRYDVEAYSFVLEALSFTLRKLKEPRHLNASELLEGIRQYAIKSFGPMAKTVFETWGIKSCEDFGEVVYDLVRIGLITKKDSDSKADFREGYDFQEAFEKPFRV
jgi:uncharacterized repeat protein (TIGR04138 family)